TVPDRASVAGSRKKPEPIMLLATMKVASTGPIFFTAVVVEIAWIPWPPSARLPVELAVPVAVAEVDHLAQQRPRHEDLPVLHERLQEQEQAGDDAQRADQPEHRHAEGAGESGARVAQHQHAQAD